MIKNPKILNYKLKRCLKKIKAKIWGKFRESLGGIWNEWNLKKKFLILEFLFYLFFFYRPSQKKPDLRDNTPSPPLWNWLLKSAKSVVWSEKKFQVNGSQQSRIEPETCYELHFSSSSPRVKMQKRNSIGHDEILNKLVMTTICHRKDIPQPRDRGKKREKSSAAPFVSNQYVVDATPHHSDSWCIIGAFSPRCCFFLTFPVPKFSLRDRMK